MLYDSFAQPESDPDEISVLVDNPGPERSSSTPGTSTPISSTAPPARRPRYLSKTLPARELVAALEAVHAGEIVVSAPPRARAPPAWTGPARRRAHRPRSRILALITQGKSNADVATITYLSPNTVKSYIRTIYRKIGVGSRTQAVLWGVNHGFTRPSPHRALARRPLAVSVRSTGRSPSRRSSCRSGTRRSAPPRGR